MKQEKWVIVLLVCSIGFQQGRATYGAAKTDDGCATDHKEHDQYYLSGEWQPKFSTGSSPDCDTPGCTDDFWGPRSRFEVEPVCPKEVVLEFTKWLREMSDQGSAWARQALILTPCDMWKMLRGRTTWVVGDSVTEDIGHAMSAFMLEYWDKENWNVTLTDNTRVLAGLEHGAKEGARDFGKRVAHWCFQMGTKKNPGRLCYLKADKLKRALHVLNLLPYISDSNDILLINLGIHYNDMTELGDDMTMLGFALGEPGLPKHKIWVETAPQHYLTASGSFDMNKPMKEQLCHPLGTFQGTRLSTSPDGSLGLAPGAKEFHTGSHKDISMKQLVAGGERNAVTQPIADAVGMPTLRNWNLSVPLHHFHTHIHLPGDGECDVIMCDCTHVCHPSWPQVVMADLPNIVRSSEETTRRQR